jgi:hypothetical protein
MWESLYSNFVQPSDSYRGQLSSPTYSILNPTSIEEPISETQNSNSLQRLASGYSLINFNRILESISSSILLIENGLDNVTKDNIQSNTLNKLSSILVDEGEIDRDLCIHLMRPLRSYLIDENRKAALKKANTIENTDPNTSRLGVVNNFLRKYYDPKQRESEFCMIREGCMKKLKSRFEKGLKFVNNFQEKLDLARYLKLFVK